MNNNVEILSLALMKALQRHHNTIISVQHYNEKLWLIYNRSLGIRYRITYSQFQRDIIGTSTYDELQEKFKEILGNQSGLTIKTSLLLTDIPNTADCILIEGDTIKTGVTQNV